MAQFTLQTFIDTHPSPGTRDNVNFWITTGSSGELYVNGLTIPLQSQESELATIISQADSVYFGEIEGLYQFKVTNGACCGSGEGDTAGGICAVNLGSLDPNNNFVTIYGTRENFHENYQFYLGSIFGGVGSTYDGQDKWHRASGSDDLGYSLKINNIGAVTSYVTCSNSSTELNPFQKGEFKEYKISAKEKIVSGSLYHYYVLFDKPTLLDNLSPLGEESINFFSFFFKPSLTSTFKYSEYEVIGNDVQEPRKSNFLLKVDRNTSQANPSNLTSIISSSIIGTLNTEEELYADVQDSYYDSISWTRSRYDGTENISRNLKLPTAFTAIELQLYVFESTVSSSLLIQEINNGTQVFPAPTTCYLYNENNLQSLSEGFRLFISSSISSSSSTLEVTKVNVERIDYNSLPANTDQGGTVLINLFRTEGIASYTNEILSITIPPGNYSGSGSFVSRQETTSYIGTLTGPATPFKNIITREIASIASTTIPNTDIINYNFRALPESRVVGSSFLLEESENKKELTLIKGKNIYDPKTRALYVTDTQGLIIDIVG